MSHHWHMGLEHVIFTGLSAIVFINLVRIGAFHLAKQDGPLGDFGTAVGGLVTFGGLS